MPEEIKSEYTAKQITVLEGLEPVRKRPGMYIGGTGVDGLHHLIWEVVDNGIDEAMAGHATEIIVELQKNNQVLIVDNGRGIPIDIHKQTKKSALETVLTTLHAGGKFGEGSYKVSGGLHGVGVSVVNALSSFMRAEVKRDNKVYTQEYSRGKTKTPLKTSVEFNPYFAKFNSGTAIYFEADPEVFEKIEYNWKTILDHLRQQAYLTKNIKIKLIDQRAESPVSYSFYFEGGISAYVKHLNKNKTALNEPPIYVEKTIDDILVEVAVQYADDYNEHIYTFANNIFTPEGGTHLTGFRSAITRAINDYGKKNELSKNGESILIGDDTREGLTAVISVKLKNPQFEGQTKAKLGNPEVRTAVESAASTGIVIYLEEHPNESRKILEKVTLSARARLAAKAARDTVIRKGALEGMTLPGKLADCSSRRPEESELYLVEGDSAGGCFSGDTKVALADGRNLTFKELLSEWKKGKTNYCYTIKKDGHIGIEKILSPRVTKKNAGVVKITLDNQEKITCTPDHKFMLRDSTYLEAKKLKPNISLMPLRKKLSERKNRITIEGYEMVLNPSNHQWKFTHLLADRYNLENKVYVENGQAHKHHLDFNKLNNNPSNIVRMLAEDHLDFHRQHADKTLHTKAAIEKCNQTKRTPEYRQKLSAMIREKFGAFLSQKAKKQWQDPRYKEFMGKKFLEFCRNNPEYKLENEKRLLQAQKVYWASAENKKQQAEKVKVYFEKHPEAKENARNKAAAEWNNQELIEWRSQKTKEQWTDDFRVKRKTAYNQTYLRHSMDFLKNTYIKSHNIEAYETARKNIKPYNHNLLKLNTLLDRFFSGDRKKLIEAVKNYNHRIKKIEFLKERINVYDIEVPNTHNFALASGVFVHNSAKSGRDRRFQAILPLRGKILNVERARLDKMLASEEIKNFIVALGAGVAETWNAEKIRYHRVIIMTDADVDGSHIRTLLLTLIYRHFREVIDKGFLYIAQPPLYALTSGKERKYFYTEEQKEEHLKGEKDRAKINIQRYKGLGEMNPEQLWETTMNPENRILKQVMIEDAETADEIFSMLMGDEVPPRKKFIQTQAKNVKNLDI